MGNGPEARLLALLALCCLTGWSSPDSPADSGAPNYLALRGGGIFFTSDLRDLALEEGFSSELVLGRRLHPHFALELGSGYFHDGDSSNGLRSDIRGIPISVTAKFLYTFWNRIELSAGAGGAVYFAKLKHQIEDAGQRATDDAVVWGGRLQLGANLNFCTRWFAGFEGKYRITETANFGGARVDLDGAAVMLNLGLRF